jgi:uncharacterized membrane protein YeaQ/YmgE (transglycosylase-associated protein family)
MITLIIFLAVWGLVVGALARLALPGPDPMSIWMTIAIGLVGSFLGGLVAGLLWHRTAGFVFSVLVSTGLVYLYRRRQGRPLTR